MPHPDKLVFRVLTTRERLGHYIAYQGYEQIGEIAVSTRVKTLHQLNEVIGHEMVHIRQERLGMRDHHGPGFMKLSALVCRRLGFTLDRFC